jgi:hypothetical protein
MKVTDDYILKSLDNYAKLNLHGRPPDEVGWIAFRLGCSRRKAEALIAKARGTQGGAP